MAELLVNAVASFLVKPLALILLLWHTAHMVPQTRVAQLTYIHSHRCLIITD